MKFRNSTRSTKALLLLTALAGNTPNMLSQAVQLEADHQKETAAIQTNLAQVVASLEEDGALLDEQQVIVLGQNAASIASDEDDEDGDGDGY